MELGTHHIVRVTSEDGNALSRLPVPNADRMIVRSGDNPGIFAVKLDRPNVVQVIAQSEQATALLIVPNLDLIVITTRHEQRLIGMESDASNGA